MKLQELKQKLFETRPDFKKEYEEYDLAFEIGMMVKEARVYKGMTQGELAQSVGSKQPSIARLEKGEALPSIRFLRNIASALQTEFPIIINSRSI